MPKKSIPNIEDVRASVIADYNRPDLTQAEVAAKNGVSAATVTQWAKKAKLPLRNRGRKHQKEPSPRQMEILKLASIYSYEKVGQRFGLHKQSIHRTVKRWQAWAQPKRAPFEPGDLLLWRGKKISVIDASHQDGTVIDEQDKVYRNFVWNSGKIPKKIGVNPKYVVTTVNGG